MAFEKSKPQGEIEMDKDKFIKLCTDKAVEYDNGHKYNFNDPVSNDDVEVKWSFKDGIRYRAMLKIHHHYFECLYNQNTDFFTMNVLENKDYVNDYEVSDYEL